MGESLAWIRHRPALKDVIARRVLVEEAPSRRRYVVRIGRPEQFDRPGRFGGRLWRCGFHISGIGMRTPLYLFGVDAFQALILALDVVPARLDQAGIAWSWLGQEAGDHGFPHHVPTGWGLAFTRRIERMIDRETLRRSKALAAKAKRRKKRPAR